MLSAGWSKEDSHGLLTAEELEKATNATTAWFQEKGISCSPRVAEGQPMALEILQALLDITNDADRQLPPLLHEGVRTGVRSTILASGVFEPEDRPHKEVESAFAQYTENWKCDDVVVILSWGRPLCTCARSADENADAVRRLLEAEVAAGWMETWDGPVETLMVRCTSPKPSCMTAVICLCRRSTTTQSPLENWLLLSKKGRLTRAWWAIVQCATHRPRQYFQKESVTRAASQCKPA